MIRLRRFAAALAGLLLVQLTLLGTGMACFTSASGDGTARATSAAAASMMHDAVDHAHHRGDGTDRTGAAHEQPQGAVPASPHDRHDEPMHCPTMLACAIAQIAAATNGLPSRGLLAEARIAAFEGVAPASVVGAPEPPPPRA